MPSYTIVRAISAFSILVPAANALAQCGGGLTGDLRAYYTFDDGTATDLSGNGNHGVINGPVSAPGISGAGFLFTADGQGINCGSTPSLNPTGGITISAWWFPGSWSGSGSDPIVDKGYVCHCGSPYYQYHLSATGDSYGTFRRSLGFHLGTTPDQSGVGSTPGEAEEWVAGQWHHLVGTWDGVTHRLYVNNVLINESPLTGTLPDFDRPMMIGTFSNLGYSIRGIVDEVRIYGHGLSPGEIDYLYQNPEGGPGFVEQPLGGAVCLGEGTTLTASPIGDTAFSQQWMYLNGDQWTPLPEGADVIIGGQRFATTSGSTTPLLALTDVRKTDAANQVRFRSALVSVCGTDFSNEVAIGVCAGDGDCDGDTDSDDVVEFFARWDAGESEGDVDGDGDTDSDDIIVFFGAWDAGC